MVFTNSKDPCPHPKDPSVSRVVSGWSSIHPIKFKLIQVVALALLLWLSRFISYSRLFPSYTPGVALRGLEAGHIVKTHTKSPADDWVDDWPYREQEPWDISTDFPYPRALEYEVRKGHKYTF